jgi:hypothetical protein
MASIFALMASGAAGPEVTLRVRGGDDLEVRIDEVRVPDGGRREVRLTGPALRLFEGRFPDSIFTA